MRLPRTSTVLAIAGLSFIAAIAVWWCQPTEEEILKRYGLEGELFATESQYKWADKWITDHEMDFPLWMREQLDNRFRNNTYCLNGIRKEIPPSQYVAALSHLRLASVFLSLPLSPEFREELKQQRHLTEVTVSGPLDATDSREDLDFLLHQSELTSANFFNFEEPQKISQVLQTCPQLTTLKLSFERLDDSFIDALPLIPELTELDLSSAEPSSRNKPIILPRKLANFWIKSPDLDLFLVAAHSCPVLTELTMQCAELTAEQLASFSHFPSLKMLKISGLGNPIEVAPEDWLQLKIPPSLETLNLFWVKVPPALLPVLAAQIPSGQRLRMTCSSRTGLSAADFAPWPQLVPDFK